MHYGEGPILWVRLSVTLVVRGGSILWLDRSISQWAFNFTDKYQFNIGLSLEEKPIEQASQHSFFGVVINNILTWESNAEFIVKKAFKRVIILQNLFKFGLSAEELVNIYKIRGRKLCSCLAKFTYTTYTTLLTYTRWRWQIWRRP